jgi:hypothetical protein
MSEASSTPTACSSSSSKYTHFTAKDSDSDSEVEEPGSGNPDDLEVVNSSKLTAVPDRNGVRFCRVCNEFLPIYAFPTGQRRYTCKTHLWMRVGIKAQKKLFAKPRKKLLSSIWNNCYKDGRRLARCLGLGARDLSLTLTQADIGSMLDAGAALEPPRSQLGVDTFDQMALLPINLMAPLSTENAALVTKDERQRLFAKLRSVQKFLKAKKSEGKPVDAYREQLESVWRRHVESVRVLPRDEPTCSPELTPCYEPFVQCQ